MCALGAIGFAAVLNLFIQPLSFVSGSFTGIAQLLDSLLRQVLPVPAGFNLTGIILFLFNIPLLFLAARLKHRLFLQKTVFSILVSMLAYSLIPVPAAPLIKDPLTAAVIGGILGGLPAGLILRGGGSGGGFDIIGLYLAHAKPGFSVGRVSSAISLFVFAGTFWRYDFEAVVYSVIFTVITSAVVDRMHYQNVRVVAWIVTEKEEAMNDFIINDLERTATKWTGTGIYAGREKTVFLTLVTKYDTIRLRRAIRTIDPTAFVAISNSSGIIGSFKFHI